MYLKAWAVHYTVERLATMYLKAWAVHYTVA